MKKAISAIGAVFLLLVSSHGGEAGWITGKVKSKWIERHQVVAFVQNAPGREATPSAERPVMDQKEKTLIPRVLPVIVGTTVEFRNGDPFKHNIFSPDGERYNLGTGEQGKSRTYTFRRPGVYRQLCNIHPEMLAYIVVLEASAFALTDGEGKFEIIGVPAGEHTLKAWGEKLTKEQLARTVRVEVEEVGSVSVEIDL